MSANTDGSSANKREYLDYLEDILEAIEKAQSVVEGMDYQEFKNP